MTAQEFQLVFSAKDRSPKPGVVSYDFVKEERRVGIYYFYILDSEFGPSFIEICTYFPYPAKVWLNGHEWAKRQARHRGIGFTELANGFSSCDDPTALQAICHRFGPSDERIMDDYGLFAFSRGAASSGDPPIGIHQ